MWFYAFVTFIQIKESKELFSREMELVRRERDQLSSEVSETVELLGSVKEGRERAAEEVQRQSEQLEKVRRKNLNGGSGGSLWHKMMIASITWYFKSLCMHTSH